MRGYFITNMYLSPIQCGIQSAHCMHDMFVTYNRGGSADNPATDKLWTWAKDHKTMIVLNGGPGDELQGLFDFLMREIEDYPFEKFNEPGIGGALTCVGIVLNEHMIDALKFIRENMGTLGQDVIAHRLRQYSSSEIELAKKLAFLPLA